MPYFFALGTGCCRDMRWSAVWRDLPRQGGGGEPNASLASPFNPHYTQTILTNLLELNEYPLMDMYTHI